MCCKPEQLCNAGSQLLKSGFTIVSFLRSWKLAVVWMWRRSSGLVAAARRPTTGRCRRLRTACRRSTCPSAASPGSWPRRLERRERHSETATHWRCRRSTKPTCVYTSRDIKVPFTLCRTRSTSVAVIRARSLYTHSDYDNTALCVSTVLHCADHAERRVTIFCI